MLPRGNAEPGPWRASRTPYLHALHEAVLDPRFRRVVGVMGTQMGKTEFLLNEIGRRMDDDPAPVIFIGASQRQVESVSTSRVGPMLRGTPSLAEKLDTRATADKVTEKFISGQRLGFAWAGSAIELSSHPAALVLLDERDHMTSDVSGEGDPVALAEARVATYPDGKVVVTSSPTLEDGSPIWELFKSGTACKWSWPCPECSQFFVPEFSLLKWPEKATPAQAKREARLACPHCGALIENAKKNAMNAAGQYEVTGDIESDTASFWVSGLASPWRTFGECARRWLEAHRSGENEQRQAVINTIFGELYKLKGEAPAASKVAERRGAYKFDEVPSEAKGMTAGVDVQGDRLVYVVRAWGSSSTSWLIRHGELWGDTQQTDVWGDLATLLEANYGALGRVRLALVDSGYRPDAVYAFARRVSGVLPSKGHDNQSRPAYIATLDVNLRGESQRRGVKLVHVDSSYFKGWIHGRIAWPADQPGAWHLPQDATDDYCEQIVAEQRIVKPTGAVKWIRTRKDNHYLDCEVLATAAAHLLQVHLLKPAPTAEAGATPPPPAAPPAPKPTHFAKWPSAGSTAGNWATSWRR